MTSADLIIIARRRAGLTQAALAARLGLPASQISRWERGAVEPSFETLRRVVAACGLALTVGLANADDSYDEFIERALAVPPAERVARMVRWGNEVQRLRPAFAKAYDA